MKTTGFLTGDRARDQRNVDLLLGAVGELYGSTGLDALLRSAVDRAIAVTGAQRGVLLLADAAGVLAVRVARHKDGRELAHDLRYSRSAVQRVWATRQPHLTIDGEGGAGAGALGRSVLDLRLLSILGVPLLAQDRPLGVLYVDSTATAKEFTDGDRAVFESLAGLVAVAIERARLAAEEAERKRLSSEVDVARKIQLSLHPRDFAAPPGFDLAGESRACVETSGDYHDVLHGAGGRLALLVGDVSGHGLGAALFMASARALVRTLFADATDPVPAFRGLNAFLCRDMPGDSFMSLLAATIDPADRSLRWVSAGHNAPLLWRAGQEMRELAPTGPVLGVVPDCAYRVGGPFTLEAGDALLLYTDGLFESRGPDGEPFGEPRLQESLAAHAAETAAARPVVDGLLADLKAYLGDRPVDDDVTCVVLRVLPA